MINHQITRPNPQPFKKIALWVVITHVFCLLWLSFFGAPKPIKKAPLKVHSKTLAPKTFTPSTPKVATPAAAQPPRAAATPTKVAVTPAPAALTATPAPAKPIKKTAPKHLQAKAPAAIAKPKKQEVKSAIPSHLIEELESSLAKLETPKATVSKKQSSTPVFTSTWKPQLTIESSESGGEVGEPGYEENLIESLRTSLHLPEFGEVKIRLTLQNNGGFVKMQVIRTQSAQNRVYLEEEIPHVRFPRFSGSLSHEKEHTFTINFCNEI